MSSFLSCRGRSFEDYFSLQLFLGFVTLSGFLLSGLGQLFLVVVSKNFVSKRRGLRSSSIQFLRIVGDFNLLDPKRKITQTDQKGLACFTNSRVTLSAASAEQSRVSKGDGGLSSIHFCPGGRDKNTQTDGGYVSD